MFYHDQVNERADLIAENLRTHFYQGYSDYKNRFKPNPPSEKLQMDAYFAGWNWAVEMVRNNR